MKCGCNNYSSSRFEPFTYLTLPVPEEKEIVLSVYIVYIGVTYPILCSIRVSSDADVAGLIRTVLDLKVPNSFPPTTTTTGNKSSSCGIEYEYILAVTLDCAVVNFYPYTKKISTFRESDVLVLFQLPAASVPIVNKAGVTSGNLSYSSSQAEAKSPSLSYGYVIWLYTAHIVKRASYIYYTLYVLFTEDQKAKTGERATPSRPQLLTTITLPLPRQSQPLRGIECVLYRRQACIRPLIGVAYCKLHIRIILYRSDLCDVYVYITVSYIRAYIL